MTHTQDGIPYYKEHGPIEVVDLNLVQCLVGRVWDRGEWGIIDRSGVMAYTLITDD